jgi:hypothetical protein
VGDRGTAISLIVVEGKVKYSKQGENFSLGCFLGPVGAVKRGVLTLASASVKVFLVADFWGLLRADVVGLRGKDRGLRMED